MSQIYELSKSRTLLWILCLAVLAVGAKNFEMGMSVDAPFYATVARNVARTGELFYLHGSVPEYRPFIYHPPLGIWLLAGIFKIVPPADWSARLLGIVFYIAFIWLFFGFIRKKSSEAVAVLSVILLWSWSRFSNYFSNVYLDPGTLFFGVAAVVVWDHALELQSKVKALAAGLLLGLAILYKGIAVGGFLAVLGACFLYGFYIRRKSGLKVLPLFSLAGVLVFGALLPTVPFLIALSKSRVPNYLKLYWDYQVVFRIAPEWSIKQLFKSAFWKELLIDTHYLFPLSLYALRKDAFLRLRIPIVGAAAFGGILLFSGFVGDQYFLYLLPWIAWLVADTIVCFVKFPPLKLVRISVGVSAVALALIHLFPLNIHGGQPNQAELEVGRLSKSGMIDRMILDSTPHRVDVTTTSRYAWYGDLEVEYGAENPSDAIPAKDAMAYVHQFEDAHRSAQLSKQGWCPHAKFEKQTIWLKCKS